MKYELTVICPGIRTKNWLNLYLSIGNAFIGSWEIIFIGPYELPEELRRFHNIKYIQDWGSPIRCQQIGLNKSEGVFISWAADDGLYLPGSLDIAYNKIMSGQGMSPHGEFMNGFLGMTTTGISFNHKRLVMGKYQEGPRLDDSMEKDWYYILSNHDSMKMPGVPIGYYMLNVGLVPIVLLREVGGWDAENFEVCPMAYNDLAIRLQRYGVEFIIQDEIMFKCCHLPGHAGDHGPIHDAQVFFDEPVFNRIYKDHKVTERIKVDIDNWQLASSRWARRFGYK